MYFIVLCIVVSICFDGSLAQVADYETTPRAALQTSFTCQGRTPGYYADVEANCKIYHVCDGNSHFTYICPRRTLFRQKMRICDHAYLVRCEESYLLEYEESYTKDQKIFNVDGHSEEDSEKLLTRKEEPVTTEAAMTLKSRSTFASEIFPFMLSSAEIDSRKRSGQKFLKLILKDFRALFYIPEVESNSIMPKTNRELLLPVDGEDNMKFKSHSNNSSFVCPGYCNHRFFVPGTCHPCIMIK